jgi:hypothetical protein
LVPAAESPGRSLRPSTHRQSLPLPIRAGSRFGESIGRLPDGKLVEGGWRRYAVSASFIYPGAELQAHRPIINRRDAPLDRFQFSAVGAGQNAVASSILHGHERLLAFTAQALGSA